MDETENEKNSMDSMRDAVLRRTKLDGADGLMADDFANNNAFDEKIKNGFYANSTDSNGKISNLGAINGDGNEEKREIRGAGIEFKPSNSISPISGLRKPIGMTMIEESESQMSLRKPMEKKFVEWKSEMTPLTEGRLEELFDRKTGSLSFGRKTTTIDGERPKSAASVQQKTWNSEPATSSKLSKVELAFMSKWNNKSPSKFASGGEDSSNTTPSENVTLKSFDETDPESIFAQLAAIGERRRPSALENLREHFAAPQGESTDDEEEAKECRAIWRERYSLSKRDDISSSSVSGDLSDVGADEDEDEQVFASNASSREESETEQYDEDGRKKKKKSKCFSSSIVSKMNLEEAGAAVTTDGEVEEDEDEGHVGDDASSLASSTSCSEDSFEIGTIVDSTPTTTISTRSVDDYVHFRHSSLLKNRSTIMNDEKPSRDFIEEDTSATPSTSSKLASCPANNGRIDEEEPGEDNNGCRPSTLSVAGVKSASSPTEDNHISTASRDSTTTTPGNQKSLADELSTSFRSLSTTNSFTSSIGKQRRSINEELSELDTALPQLDFEKLEKQLTDAALEREMNQRKLMSEHVLRRLTTDTTVDQPRYHPPPATKRPLKSNLGARLQSGMNLQICFMNDAAPTDDDEDEGEWGDDEDEFNAVVPKSRSTPNLGQPSGSGSGVGRSVSSCGDSNKRASELRKAMLERHKSEDKDFSKRQARLEEEAKVMLVKAKQAAHMQMEMERQGKTKESVIEKVIGVPSLGRRKLTRSQLTKMCITQLQIILNDLHSKVEVLSDELVHLLMERDSLHMEQDSMLVDIEDLLQHQKCVDLRLPDFLTADPVITNSLVANNNNNNNNKHTRFRIFKR